jgi:NAD-reducing hydrogenase large subunit
VHGTGAVPGGINKLVTTEERDWLQQQVPQMRAWAQDAVAIAKQLHAQNPVLYNHFGSFRSNMLSLVRADGAMELYDGVLRVRDDRGRILADQVSDQNYLQLIEEEVRAWSYMKFPHLKSLGRALGWYRVGPLARVQNCDFIDTPLAEIERQAFVAWGQGDLVHATLAYHWARMIELLHAVEVIGELLDDPALVSGDLVRSGTRQRSGVGMIEAPRGTLIHDYDVGDDDLVTRCNLIVSTTHNNQAMNEAVRAVARDYLSGHELTEGLLNHIEVAIRAYDPCLSCATHALGQMPLDVTLLGPDGTLLDRVQKASDGALTRQISSAIGLQP